MSTEIYAGTITTYQGRPEIGPVIPFASWSARVAASDAEERSQRGEDWSVPNPAYVPNASMRMSGADALFAPMGLDLGDGPVHFPLDVVQRAALRLLNTSVDQHAQPAVSETGQGGARMHQAAISAEDLRAALQRLLAIIATGRQHGATILVAA